MKVVIFAGGLGSRLSEETETRPKPMVEIGGRPILWHIMKHYAHHGMREFVIALGYRGDVIKRWLLDMAELDGNLTLSLRDRNVVRHERPLDEWTLSLIETGLETQTGGRLAKLARSCVAGRSCSPTATASPTWISGRCWRSTAPTGSSRR